MIFCLKLLILLGNIVLSVQWSCSWGCAGKLRFFYEKSKLVSEPVLCPNENNNRATGRSPAQIHIHTRIHMYLYCQLCSTLFHGGGIFRSDDYDVWHSSLNSRNATCCCHEKGAALLWIFYFAFLYSYTPTI